MIPEDILLRGAGAALGALLSVMWMKEASLIRKVLSFFAGLAFAVGAQSEIARRSHWEQGFLLSFVLGLCSMALCSKVYVTWQNFNLGGLARDAARKWMGLPPAPPTQPAALKDK